MVLKLYGFDISTCTKRVGVVLHEKNIPFEFHSLDLSKNEHKSPEYKEKQPFGQAPYLVSFPSAAEILWSAMCLQFIIRMMTALLYMRAVPLQGTSRINTPTKAPNLFRLKSRHMLCSNKLYLSSSPTSMRLLHPLFSGSYSSREFYQP